MPPKSDTHPRPRAAGAKTEAQRLTHMLAVDIVPDSGLDMKICANEAERLALAAQCGVASVQSFEADFQVRKQSQGRFRVSGDLKAQVTQTCVVSLEPFESEISAEIGAYFAPLGTCAPEISAAAADSPDPIVDGQIDLGALAAEFLALNLDLYPRKPGVVFEETDAGAKADEQTSPFAVLLRR